MKILIFLHGTTIMHKTALGKKREERVQQVIDEDPSVRNYENYVPVGNTVNKLKTWEKQGADIYYLSSHESIKDLDKDKIVLDRYGFPKGNVLWRSKGESYSEVAENVMPDVLIEDDCESIGGEPEMTYPNIKPDLKNNIKHVVVKEFQGIDHLPDETKLLLI